MKSIVFLVVNVSVFLLVFLFGNAMTTTPGRSSGNGNPAILLFAPIIILFIILIVQWFKVFKHKKLSGKFILSGMVLVVIHIAAGTYYQVQQFHKYKDYLAEVYERQHGETDWQYINSITEGLSIHINNQYFNVNTFLMCVSFSFFLFLVLHRLIR
ncbi:hypothetical protein EBB07_25420 [Paenibacillaceae bacterium]|nr:hypothetical protein EBB07_25420 [Paenibacillaceae bacterium]